jgi:hypothetical protein
LSAEATARCSKRRLLLRLLLLAASSLHGPSGRPPPRAERLS